MLDLTKPVKTRDGREVRIYATDHGGEYPVAGAIRRKSTDQWRSGQWTADGTYIRELQTHLDLINAPQPFHHVFYVNVYPSTVGPFYDSRAEADQHAGSTRIACIRVVLEGHEGRYDD